MLSRHDSAMFCCACLHTTCESFRTASDGTMSTCSGRSHLAVPSAGVALVGDAGHGVTPNLGQGCNAALETAAILGRVGSARQSVLAHDAAARSTTTAPESIEVAEMKSGVLLQVLEQNEGKGLADSLAEFNHVRKPDMDALRRFDTISSRIWGGQSPLHSDSKTSVACNHTFIRLQRAGLPSDALSTQ
jgi:hypothetical protein